MSQSVCPWNVRFASELKEGSPFAAREVTAGKVARTLAREILEMSQEEFAAAFRHSPMKRAKLRGLKRNAAVVLGNIGDAEPLMREHAAWAMNRTRAARTAAVTDILSRCQAPAVAFPAWPDARNPSLSADSAMPRTLG